MVGMKIVVLGGGLSGLMASLWVKRRHPDSEVTLFEKQPWLGGKLRRIEIAGQTADIGPSIFTFPSLWQSYLKKLSFDASSLKFRRLDGLGDFVFSDGRIVSIPQTSSDWSTYLERFSKDVSIVRRLMEESPISGIPYVLRYTLKHGLHVRSALKFMRSSELYPVIAIQSLNSGLNIDEAMSVFASIPAAVHEEGVWIPEGGMYEIVRFLELAARDSGVRIVTENGARQCDLRTRTLTLENADTHPYDVLISSIDEMRWKNMVGVCKSTEKGRYSCSAFAMYGVTSKELPVRHLHTVLMPDDFEKFQGQLAVGGDLDSTMCFLNVYKPRDIYPDNSKTVVAFLMTVPAGKKSWTLNDPLVKREIRRLGRMMKIELLSDLESIQTIDPQYLEHFGSWGGAIYGRAAPWYRQGPLAGFRHQSDRHHFHVGTSVFPGGGLPGITAGVLQMIQKFEKTYPLKTKL